MAFQAKQVHVAAPQQPRIGRSMRRMASNATLGLDRSMLKGKRNGLVCVTIKAKLVLRGCGPQLVGQESTVRVVAVAACHLTFIHLVVIRLGEIRFDVEMAGV